MGLDTLEERIQNSDSKHRELLLSMLNGVVNDINYIEDKLKEREEELEQ